MQSIKIHTVLFVVLSVFSTASLFCQNTQDSTNNYYYYTQKLDAVFDSLIEQTPDTVKIPGYNDYNRYKEFWNTRVYNCDTATGNYSKYIEQLNLYSQNPSMIPTVNMSNTWEFVGPKNLTSHNQGIIVSLYIDPNNINSIMAGTNNSGLFKTTNGGQDWENVTDNIAMPGLGICDIAVNPNNPSEIYIATGNDHNNYGLGVFKTTDNCNSWEQILAFNPDERLLSRRLLIDSENPSIIYALVNKYVYRSMDGGNNWTMIFDQLSIPNYWDKNKYLIDIEFKPNDHNTVYISSVSIKTKENPTHEYSAEIWNTHNAKASSVAWQRIENGLPDYEERYSLETDPQNPDMLYIGFTGPGSSSNYSSFYLKSAEFPNYTIQDKYQKLNIYNSYSSQLAGIGYWRFEMELSPANSNILFLGGYNLDVLDLTTNQIVKSHHVTSSSDPEFHVDQRVFKATISAGKTYLFCGNDGGVSKYNYTDDNMESINGYGLDNLQYFGIGDCEVMPEFYIGGTQDNGEIGSHTGSWYRTNVGDSYENIIDPIAPNIVYCTNNGGNGKNIQRSTDYGEHFSEINIGIPQQVRQDYGLEDRPFVMSPQDKSNFYIGYHEVYKTTNSGSNWQQFTNFHNNGYDVSNAIKAIALTSASTNIIYVGYNGATWVASGSPRLLKTNDGGATWTDLTSGIIADIVHYNSITDIKVSDLNPTDVWISFAGFQENNGNAINKVLHSTNSGNNWADITANLPNLPVNRLQKLEIDNTCYIIAGNDIGLFMYDSQQGSWINISNGLPPASVSDIEFNYKKSELRAGTFGRGIWESKLPCTLPGDDIHISLNQVWSRNKVLSNSLYIEGGYTLEIKSNISFTADAKIIIKPGAKLILDGSTLTNACSVPWQGIQVWGNKSRSQFPDENGDYQQGFLELKNGAVIENAIVAVDLWKPDDYSTTGEIVHADGAIFRNNAKSVHALHYKNYNPYDPTQEFDYNSHFKNCTFEITNDYPGNETFYKHVDLAYVKGINFQACNFSLAENVADVSPWNHAIAGYDAKFGVKAICNSTQTPCPVESYDKCSFTGFWSAISAVNDGGSTVSFSVNRADFINNAYGVRTQDMNNVSVLFSEFNIGYNNTCAPGTGIYLGQATGFAFEENSFAKFNGAPTDDYFGIHINNTVGADEVYKNYFNGLSYANYSEGYNWIPWHEYLGLAYFCNENTANYADFYVANRRWSGIQSTQGDNEHVTGNKFSQDQSTKWHFYNGGGHLVDYHYCDYCDDETPDIDKIDVVNPIGHNFDNNCLSHYGGNSQLKLVLTPQQKTDAEQMYYDNLTDYNNVKTLYDNLVDGGDTETEKLDIQTAQPEDMWALWAQLLGDSPHLSFDVLKEVADKTDVFTESALFDILAANPDELKKDTLISYLENKEEPLPEYMIDILRQLANGITYKTVLQQEMARYNHNYTRAANEIIRSNLNDTVSNYNELRNWLDNLGGITSDRQIVTSYIQEGNFADALTLANMLPQLYSMEGDELTEHGYYIDMLNLFNTLHQEGRNTYQLNGTEKASLELIADNSKGIAGSQAKSILEAVYDLHYIDCPETDGTVAYKNSNININELGKAYGLSISVKPNPAKQWAAFDYTLPNDQSTATITITDVTGGKIEALQVSGSQGQKLWDTRNIKPGVYIYTLQSAGFNQSGKIIISQ